MSNFTLLKSDCPICGGFRNDKKKHDCKRSGELVHCFSHNEPPSGWVCTGRSAIGQSLYAPAKGKDFDPEKHRAELAKLRAEHQAKEAKRRAELPTIPERHQEILKFKAELTEDQNTDLLIRGLFQEEIDLALANHWLFACRDGFGIAAIDPVTGLFCGAQRAKDDRSPKYDWGIFTGKNQLKETNDNPLAVWIYPDFDPTQPYEIEIGEKYLGSLIRALVRWRKNPQVIVIGAAGGLFGENLRRVYAPFPEPKSITFFPDAGSQDLKKLNLYSGYKKAVQITDEVYGNGCNDPQLKFADWGQWRDKSKGDYDEYFGRYKRRSPWDWLRPFKFAEDLKRAKERLKTSDKITPDLRLTVAEFLAFKDAGTNGVAALKKLTNGARDVHLKGGRGLGKTELARLWADWERGIAPYPTNSLVENSGVGAGFSDRRNTVVLKDGKRYEVDEDGTTAVNRLAYCNESYLGVKPTIEPLLRQGAGEFVDEFDHQLESLYLSSTHGKEGKRQAHINGFWETLTRVTDSLVVSADLTDFEVQQFHYKTGRKPFVIEVIPEKKQRIDTIFEDTAEWWANFLQMRRDGLRILVLCTHKRDAQFFRVQFGAIAIHADNSKEFRDQGFFKNPDAWCEEHKPQLLVLSPICLTGFSIKGNHFDAVFGLFKDNIPAKSLMQFLDRYRPDVPRFIWCEETSGKYSRLTPETCYKFRLTQCSNDWERQLVASNPDDPKYHYEAENRWSRANLRADLLARLERDVETVHYRLCTMPQDVIKEMNRQVSEWYREFSDLDYLLRHQAPNISETTAREYREKEKDLTHDQRRSLEKFDLADWKVTTPDQLTLEEIKRDKRGKRRKGLEKIEMQAFPQIAIALDQKSVERQAPYGIAHQDITHYAERVKLLEEIGVGEFFDFALNYGVWNETHPLVQKVGSNLRSRRDELELVGISLTCGKNAGDNAYWGSLMRVFDLKTVAPTDGTPAQKTINGKRVRNRQLCPNDLELTKADLIARLPRNIERFRELTVKAENQWVKGIYELHTPFENIEKQGGVQVEQTALILDFPTPPSAPMPTAIAPISEPTPEPVAISAAPKYQKGDRVWFLRAGEWIKGTVQAVYQGIVTEYNCLDPKGMGFFTKEVNMNPT